MNEDSLNVAYKDLLWSLIKSIEKLNMNDFNEFLYVLKEAHNVVKNFDDIIVDLISNNTDDKNQKINKKKINSEFKEIKNNEWFNKQENNLKKNKDEILFYSNWKKKFEKSMEKTKDSSNIKFTYFRLINTLFEDINTEYVEQIDMLANLLLKDSIKYKDEEENENAKQKIINEINKNTNINGKIDWMKFLMPIKKVEFLSYSFDDKFYTLLLFNIAKENRVFLCVDWIINDKAESGEELKKTLYKILNSSKSLLFLRTLNSEFQVQGRSQIRQWCSWEIGMYYHKESNDKKSYILRLADTNIVTKNIDFRYKESEKGLFYKPTDDKKGKENELFLEGLRVVSDIPKHFT